MNQKTQEHIYDLISSTYPSVRWDRWAYIHIRKMACSEIQEPPADTSLRWKFYCWTPQKNKPMTRYIRCEHTTNWANLPSLNLEHPSFHWAWRSSIWVITGLIMPLSFYDLIWLFAQVSNPLIVLNHCNAAKIVLSKSLPVHLYTCTPARHVGEALLMIIDSLPKRPLWDIRW